MRLTRNIQVAVIALSEISKDSRPTQVAKISTIHNVSVTFLDQVCRRLRKANLIKSIRGPGGGYLLARPVNQISLHDVIASQGKSVQLSDMDAKPLKNMACIQAKVRSIYEDTSLSYFCEA